MTDNNGFDFTFNESDYTPTENWNIRDLLLFVIDCTEPMFKAKDNDDSFFKLCLKACKSVYMNKIIGMSSDPVGIMFFGTDVKDPGLHNPHNIVTFAEPKKPDADIIKKIEAIINSENCCDFATTYGHSNDYKLSEVLWHASFLIGKCPVKVSSKKIILMTCNDEPHADDPMKQQKQHFAFKKGADFQGLGIELDIVPLGTNFDGDLFYNELLNIVCNRTDRKINVNENKIEQMEKSLYRKDYKKRSIGKLKFNLGDEIIVGVELYTFYRPLKCPPVMKLNRKSNEEVKVVTHTISSETGERLLKSDLRKCTEISGSRVAFDSVEYDQLRIMVKPSLTLLGFKSLQSLSFDKHFRSSNFIYPSDEDIKGSTFLFVTLLNQCLEKKKYALCYLMSRLKGKPSLVALLPQEEILDDRNVQILPPGFHIIYLPYADNIREIPLKKCSKLSDEQISLFSKIIKKLRIKKYDVQMFENPKLQTHWANIEALALNYSKPREVEDCTTPDYDKIQSRLGELENKFLEMFYPEDYDLDVQKKRLYPKSEEKSKKIKFDPVDPEYVLKMVVAGQAEKLTVEVLKKFLTERNVPIQAKMKKVDLLNCLYYELKIEK